MEKIKWTKKSISDLQGIYRFISLDSEKYANRFVDQIISRVDQLRDFPLSGRIVPEMNNPNIRELIYGNYRIFYKTNLTNVTIIRIHHSSRHVNEMR